MADNSSVFPHILIVDDEEEIRRSLEKIFKKENFTVTTAASSEEALVSIENSEPDIVLTDLFMPGLGGMELLRSLKKNHPDLDVIVMTAYGTIDTAGEVFKGGAADFITKPLKRQEVVKAVNLAIGRKELIKENKALKFKIATGDQDKPVFASANMQRLLETVKQAAATDVTILLTGESGTGKEVFAHIIHDNSQFAAGPFVAVNCAALPENILESELFGHEKGAFTGAIERHVGRFERADGGTLFLDEVGEMSPALQVRLLRVLQDGTFERVGGQKSITVKTRIIAATNIDLNKAVSEGRFREDLFYRLNVVSVHLPPLRDRVMDIAPLSAHFVDLFAKRYNKNVTIAENTIDILESYTWPGNVRELANVIERALALAQPGGLITPNDLPPALKASGHRPLSQDDENIIKIPFGMKLDEVEDLLIRETLKRTGGDKRKAAGILGINARTIYRRLGDERPDDES